MNDGELFHLTIFMFRLMFKSQSGIVGPILIPFRLAALRYRFCSTRASIYVIIPHITVGKKVKEVIQR